jgi:hypothetical protein
VHLPSAYGNHDVWIKFTNNLGSGCSDKVVDIIVSYTKMLDLVGHSSKDETTIIVSMITMEEHVTSTNVRYGLLSFKMACRIPIV